MAEATGSAEPGPNASDSEVEHLVPELLPVEAARCDRIRRTTLAAGSLLAVVAVAAVALSLQPQWSQGGGGAVAGVRTAISLAEASAALEAPGKREAEAIVHVLNKKPTDEIDGLVQKAVQAAGARALQRRKQRDAMKSHGSHQKKDKEDKKHGTDWERKEKEWDVMSGDNNSDVDWYEEQRQMFIEGQARTERKAVCAFDIIYAVQSVARAGLNIQAAARTCPNAKGLLEKICALNALFSVAALSNLALYVSDAASVCAESVRPRALCASGVEALVVALSTAGAGGIVAAETCKPGLKPADLHLPPGATPADLQGPPPGAPISPGRRLFLGGGRNNFVGQCVLDWTEVAWSLAAIGLSITTAARDVCPDDVRGIGLLARLSKAGCAMDVGQVIYALGRIATFIAVAFVHCTNELNLQALCSAGITAIVASSAAVVVAGGAFFVACKEGIDVVDGGGSVPLRIGAAAEAGATRRLAAQAPELGAMDSSSKEMMRLVESYGFNITNPKSMPVFENVDSALRALEAFTDLQTKQTGLSRQALSERFGDVDTLWSSLGFNSTYMPPPPRTQGASERFVRLMEPALSDEDRAQVKALTA
mmetsp:Transcript_102743/g.316997  ORF Transcript_102743/g.316997 Transcript_102743/m.316997 type:complete len:595 (+) Transcript_102743:78-1862(+)